MTATYLNAPVMATAQIIAQAAQLLRTGHLVAFPTETVYGLGADARNPTALKRIFAAKGRPEKHPLIVHLPNIEHLTDWAINIPPEAYLLAKQFWPGPLTLVLAKHPQVPLEVTGGQPTVALRIPQHPIALQLLQTFGGGIAAPSANRFCRISPTQAQHVLEELGDTVDLILDGGACSVGLESSIVDLTAAVPRLLRPGKITPDQIISTLNTELALSAATLQADSAEDIRVPGMLALHYAPLTLTLRCTSAQLPIALEKLQHTYAKIGVLSCTESIIYPCVNQIHLPAQVDIYAQGLYTALRKLDHLNLDVIVVEQPPTIASWQAINDRLHKAARIYE